MEYSKNVPQDLLCVSKVLVFIYALQSENKSSKIESLTRGENTNPVSSFDNVFLYFFVKSLVIVGKRSYHVFPCLIFSTVP